MCQHRQIPIFVVTSVHYKTNSELGFSLSIFFNPHCCTHQHDDTFACTWCCGHLAFPARSLLVSAGLHLINFSRRQVRVTANFFTSRGSTWGYLSSRLCRSRLMTPGSRSMSLACMMQNTASKSSPSPATATAHTGHRG